MAEPLLRLMRASSGAHRGGLAAAGAAAEVFQGVEQQLEAMGRLGLGLDAMHRTVIQRQRQAAGHAGEVMGVTLPRGIESFAAGEVAAAGQAKALELAQVPVNRGQPDRLAVEAQALMQILTGELLGALAQHRQHAHLFGVELAGGRLTIHRCLFGPLAGILCRPFHFFRPVAGR